MREQNTSTRGGFGGGAGPRSRTATDVASGPLRVRCGPPRFCPRRTSPTSSATQVCPPFFQSEVNVFHFCSFAPRIECYMLCSSQEVRDNKLPHRQQRPVTADALPSTHHEGAAGKLSSAVRPATAGDAHAGPGGSNTSQVTRNRFAARNAVAAAGGGHGGQARQTARGRVDVGEGEGGAAGASGLSGVTGTAVGLSAGAGRQRFDSGGAVNAVVAAEASAGHDGGGGGGNGSRVGATGMTQHQRVAGARLRQKPTGAADQPTRNGSAGGADQSSSSLEVMLRERLDALEQRLEPHASTSGRRAEAADEDEDVEKVGVLSSVFDTIIGRSKTYGHLLATVKRHYEVIILRSSRRRAARESAEGDSAAAAAATGDAGGVEGKEGVADESFRSAQVADYVAELSAAEKRSAAAAAEAKRAVKSAERRAAIAKAAAASAAQSQVTTEAEAIRLTDDNRRLRDEADAHVAAVAAARAEVEAAKAEAEEALRARDDAVAAKDAAEASAADITEARDDLQESVSESRREIDELDAVLRARTQDITQLGQIIISVHKGEIQSEQLGEIAAGIANIIGPHTQDDDDGDDDGGGSRSDEPHADESQSPPPQPETTALEENDEEEDTSVPIDSAFYGVDADEITWEEPLSVRVTKTRPKGMPGLALEKLAPPPDDPDAAMLEFAYEQQYGKEEATRLIAEAKAAEAAKQQQ